MPFVKRLGACWIVWCLSCAVGVFLPSTPARGADLRYRFTPNEELIYQITVTVTIDEYTRTTVGWLFLRARSVDPAIQQTSLNYTWALQQIRSKTRNDFSNTAFPVPTDASHRAIGGPEVVVNGAGAVLNEDKLAADAQLDAMQGLPWRLVLQPLPPDGQTTWKTHRRLNVYRNRGSGNPSSAEPARRESPAEENITYSIVPQASQLTVSRNYDLVSLEKVGDTPVEHLSGNGQYVFNIDDGRVDHVHWSMDDVITGPDASVRVPIEVMVSRASAEQFAAIQAGSPIPNPPTRERPIGQRRVWQNPGDDQRALTPPSASAEAEQLGRITWHEHGDGKSLLADLLGQPAPEGQPISLKSNERLTTKVRFRPPVTFQVVALSNLSDTRIGYAFQQIIFNWEMRHNELRVDGGPNRGFYPKPGVGQLPPNEWVGIELTVTPTEAILSVNGQEIDRLPADYSRVNDPFSIEAHNGPLLVKSVKVIQR